MSRKTVRFSSVPRLRSALRAYPKELRRELTDASQEQADLVVQLAQGKAAGIGRQQARVASTLAAYRRTTPTIKMGGTAKLRPRPRRPRTTTGWARQTVGDIMWGAEFGSFRFPQFPPRTPRLGRGNAGLFLWPAIRESLDDVRDEYARALEGGLARKGG